MINTQFRAKTVEHDSQESVWVYGDMIRVIMGEKHLMSMPQTEFDEGVTDDGYGFGYMMYIGVHIHRVQEDTICKNTGEVDVNGNPVYQFDTVKEHFAKIDTGCLHLVDEACSSDENFIVGYKIGSYSDSAYEIVGNKFDNPELIEQC